MRTRTALVLFLAVGACSTSDEPPSGDLAATAEAFFRAVYGCAPDRLQDLASADVTLSYPIFETLYGTGTIRGLEAAVDFSNSFCRRWAQASMSVDEVVQDGNRVVLVWSFSANDQLSEDASDARRSWGGISVFRFDESGRVLEEFGEESTPGPTARRAATPGL